VSTHPADRRWPTRAALSVPAVTAAQMREVDRLMIESVGVGLELMMENAGRTLADLAIGRFEPTTVTVLAGVGGNGGGGIAAARHLSNRGVQVTLVLAGEPEPGGAVAAQAGAARACGVTEAGAPPPADMVIDALVGYSLSGPLRGRVAELVAWASSQGVPVLALDVPTGLDATTGVAEPGTVRAAATLTLALPKTGLVGSPEVGELYLADISVPVRIYAEIGLESPRLFDEGQLVRLLRPVEVQR
jgi:NAD(P)H-hydrate epimerase